MMMQTKINHNNGETSISGSANNKSRENTSNFNDIFSNKRLDKSKIKDNETEISSHEKNISNRPKKKISKKQENLKEEDLIDEQDSKIDYKQIQNLLMSIIQNPDDEIDLEELELAMEDLKSLDIVGIDLIPNIDLEEISLLKGKEMLQSDEFSELLISRDSDVLESLKNLSNDLEENSQKSESTINKSKEINIVNTELEKSTNLESKDTKEIDIFENENKTERPLIEVKDNRKSQTKEKSSESTDEIEVETNDSNSFRTDIKTDDKSKLNIKTDKILNTSLEVKVNEEDVIKQITEKIHFEIGEETTEIKLSLKPKILGDMIMNLEITKGEIVAKVFVDNHKTKQIIESNLIALQKEVEDTGMEIKTFEVFVGSNTDYEQPDQGQSSFFNRNKQNRLQNKKNRISANISTNYESGTVESNGSSLLTDEVSMDLQA